MVSRVTNDILTAEEQIGFVLLLTLCTTGISAIFQDALLVGLITTGLGLGLGLVFIWDSVLVLVLAVLASVELLAINVTVLDRPVAPAELACHLRFPLILL